MISSCEVVQKTSQKGNEYFYITITFSNGYKKYVKLDFPEQYMLKSLHEKSTERR